jgi:hypothetical protein
MDVTALARYSLVATVARTASRNPRLPGDG